MNKILALLFVAAVLIEVNARPEESQKAETGVTSAANNVKEKASEAAKASKGLLEMNPLEVINRSAQGFVPAVKKTADNMVPETMLAMNERFFG